MISKHFPNHSDPLRSILNRVMALWATEDRSELLRQLIQILGRDFRVEDVACACLKGDGGWEIEPSIAVGNSVLTQGISPLQPEVLAMVQRAIATDPDLVDGVFFLTVSEIQYGAFLVSGFDKTRLLFTWQVSASTSHRSMDDLDFLVRAVQREMRWYHLMETAQDLVYMDDLTGLFNMRYLEIAIDQELKRSQRFKTPFSLLFVDLDGFKPINDRFGHLSGSSILTQVAQVIRDVVREVDIPIRYGGDEFVIVLVGSTCSSSLTVAERIRQRIAECHFRLLDQGIVRITCSIGVASYPDHGDDLKTLLKMADENMYQSKKLGKNRVSIVNRRNEEQPR